MQREVVMVTGAGAGLGRAIVRRFARSGVAIGLLSRGAERLRDAAREVEERGGEALALPTDVADADQVERAAAAVEARFGPIDVWVNNAMTSAFSPARESVRAEPGLLDRYLGRTGYDAQQTDEPEPPDRPDNLWQPVPGDFAAHGRFDERSRNASPEVWATLHRRWVAVAGAGMAALALATYARTR